MAERKVSYETPWGPVYVQEQNVGGYEKDSIPLWGCCPTVPACCHCETDGPLDCGCAFGQCALGLILVYNCSKAGYNHR